MEGIAKSEQETLTETFVGITSSTREEALFFLESHNWQLESSIHSFFESQQEPVLLPQHNITATAAGEEEEEEYVTPPAIFQPPPAMMTGSREARSRKKKKKTAASGSGSKIRTLSDLNRGSGPESDSDVDDGPQEYYTGGEKSGMLVQDPSRGGHDVDSIFDQARQMGAMQGPFEHNPSSSSRNFTGTGRLLSGETVAAAPQQPENVVHNICFWTNGFTVNDGPLRRFDDPENAPFLESIRRSECPKELEPEDRRSAVHCNLIRREENCPEPVKRVSPFQGLGRTLGSGGSSTDSPANESTAAAAVATTASSSAAGPLVVDDSLPTTSIQLRLADGTRTVARFNTHHTVGDIRAFINNLTSSRHGRSTTYTLQTVGFPPKQLTDLTRTIQQEGIANSVVIQKL